MKINTVKIGDDFEKKSFDIIEKALNSKELGLIPEQCSIYRKKKYSSFRRKNGIIFDLSIEVTPPKSDRPTLLYLIECKKYTSSIAVDEVAVFASYISEIDGYATKGVFVTNNKLQSGALDVIKSHGMMLIEVNEDDYNIIHYKNELLKNQAKEIKELDDKIIRIIQNALLPKKIEGLKKLSIDNIDCIVCEFLNKIDSNILSSALATPLDKVIDYLRKEKSIEIENTHIKDDLNKSVLGYYDLLNKKILINQSIVRSLQYPFVLAHEIGHFILHSNLKVNNVVYNNFKDIQFSSFEQSYAIRNEKNWVEWQANCFAASLLMPKSSILMMLIIIQKELGISKTGKIYLDNQICNQQAYIEILDRLSIHFGVAKINVEYRLNDLKLVERPKLNKNDDDDREFLRSLSIFNSNRDN